ncbi:MAG: DUF6932 family protein [Blastocatellia bacterium]
MIPPFRRNGTLPPGVHWTTWEEFADRFGGNQHRQDLLAGLKAALENLQQAGCQDVYIDGSFVTAKAEPQDFDGCWSKVGVDPDKLDPVLLDFSQDRAAQKAKYGGELFIAQAPANEQHVFLGFFQRDRRNQRKGIIGIKLSEEVL